MWAGLGWLFLLSISLAVSSLLAGSLPLVFNLSRRHMRLLTACGTGILMGTALIVIIPEGVETLYSARTIGAHESHELQTRGGVFGHSMAPLAQELHEERISREGLTNIIVTRQDHGAQVQAPSLHRGQFKRAESDQDFEPHSWIGVSVITGFILMFLIDRLPKLASAPKQLRPAYISLGRMSFRRGSNAVEDEAEEQSPAVTKDDSIKPVSTTTGLVIHAAADGIALGASSASSQQKLSMIIFVALMIHKAPAAFGLTAVLLKQGLPKRNARAHLLVFSLAAPVGAFVTFFAAHIIGGSALDSGSKTTFVTALLLLFSGGTFLYVAMHTMQDAGHEHGSDEPVQGNGYADIYQHHQQAVAKDMEGPTIVETFVTVGGMLLPLLTQVGHAH